MSATATRPLLSVIVPLEDDRGELERNLATWTRDQSLDRDRYEVVVVSPGGDHPGVARAGAVLGAQDRVVSSRGERIIERWNTGAREAASDWLFLTEAHCLGDTGCLAAVASRLTRAGPGLEVVTVEHGHVAESKVERLGADWFDEVYAVWNAPGAWTRLNLVGFAIRRDTFFAEGGLVPRYGMFAAPMLSARLSDRAARIEHAAEALVLHKQNHRIREHHELSEDYARGELDARGDVAPEFARRYFGEQELWTNQLLYTREVARPLAAVLALATARAAARRHPDAAWLARELVPLVGVAALGPRPRVAFEWVRFRVNEELAIRLPERLTRRRRGYTAALDRVVRLGRLRWIAARHGAPAPAPREGRLGAAELAPDTLVGAHAIEHDDGGPLRWTQPAALLRIGDPGPGGHALVLELADAGGAAEERVRAVYVGARRLGRDALRWSPEGLRIELPDGWRGGAVTLLTRPLDPAQLAPGDSRRLGLPLRGIAIG